MAQLPFGKNPFARRGQTSSTAAATQPRPPPAFSSAATVSTPFSKNEKTGKRKEANDAPQGQHKKSKPGVADGEAPNQLVSAAFGSLAATHLSDDDARLFMKRSSDDAEYSFKMGLSEAFYHGLNVLTEKNAIIEDQAQAIKKWKGEASSFKSQLQDAQKKFDEDFKAQKGELDKLQHEFEKLSTESKVSGEALTAENEKLKGELSEFQRGKDRELSEAYNLGFLGYLQNFLAGDPDYDWSKHFAPSTSAYMTKYKAENAQAIEEAREELRQKIKSELEAKAGEEAKKGPGGSGEQVVENAQNASPSETTVT